MSSIDSSHLTKVAPGTVRWGRRVESLSPQGLAFFVIHTVLDARRGRTVPSLLTSVGTGAVHRSGMVEECAKFMHITPERVRQLAKLRVLRTRYAWGDVLVQPALIPGVTG